MGGKWYNIKIVSITKIDEYLMYKLNPKIEYYQRYFIQENPIQQEDKTIIENIYNKTASQY